MVKRKKAKKEAAKAKTSAAGRSMGKGKKSGAGRAVGGGTPVPAVALKLLSVVLAVILVIALTLYVLGRMPARGFWVLIILLAVIAFFVMPAMRKRFVGE